MLIKASINEGGNKISIEILHFHYKLPNTIANSHQLSA
jgi:hypothetical protein